MYCYCYWVLLPLLLSLLLLLLLLLLLPLLLRLLLLKNIGFLLIFRVIFGLFSAYFVLILDPWGQPWGPLEAEGRPLDFSQIFGLISRHLSL